MKSVLADILDSGTERSITTADFTEAMSHMTPSTVDWLNTARNLVKFSAPITATRMLRNISGA